DEAVEDRRRRVGRMVAGAADADLVVLPELWAVGYFAFDSYRDAAESWDGPTITAGREWARTCGVHLHLGSFVERDDHGRLFNTAVLIAPDGTIQHTYRKVHLFGHGSREAELVTPGRELPV